MIEVLDLFAGAGGFSVGAHRITSTVLGIELDDDAVATQLAAGMSCRKRDITKLPPEMVGKVFETSHLHLHASPPCQTFSAAGKGRGRPHVGTLSAAVRQILFDADYEVDLSEIPAGSLLVLEPARWIRAVMPDSVSLEQVRSVLPIWEAYADGLMSLGYFSWTALLNAEQYGVPQTRCRAWLGASLHKVPEPPAPTHSRYHVRAPERLDPDVAPWVSMAEALGWCEHGLTGFPRRADTPSNKTADVVTIDGIDYRARDLRADDKPSFVVTEKARSWSHWRAGAQDRATTRPVTSPAGTIAFGNDMAQMRFTDATDVGYETFTHYAPAGVGQKNHPASPRELGEAPAPTVTAEANHYFFNAEDFEPGQQLIKHKDETMADVTRRRLEDGPATTIQGDDRVWPRGHKVNQSDIDRLGEDEARERYGDRAGKRARKITVAEAGVLQGFPVDYPWQGTKTSQFRQCGNAVPPQVAEAVLRSLL